MSRIPSMKCSKCVLMVPGKVHHMPGVAETIRGQQKHLIWERAGRRRGAISVGQITSTSSGRCGPCCSTALHGNTQTLPSSTASLISGQVSFS